MRPADNITKLFKKLHIRTSAQLDEKIYDEISRAAVKTKYKESANTQPNLWRIIMKSRLTKLTAAAVIIIAIIIGINQFGGSIDLVKPAYGITDVAELFQAAKTIHMKGRMYFPLSKPGKEQSSVEVEYWLDMENSRWKLTHPGYSSGPEGIKIHVSEVISDGEYSVSCIAHNADEKFLADGLSEEELTDLLLTISQSQKQGKRVEVRGKYINYGAKRLFLVDSASLDDGFKESQMSEDDFKQFKALCKKHGTNPLELMMRDDDESS